VWLYLTGHGESTQGAIRVKNGNNWFEWHKVFEKLDLASSCPATMDYYANQCRQPGYCNINMIVQACYSGFWQRGYRHGVNILTSANETQTSYGRPDGDGSHVSNEFWNAFLGDADLSEHGGNQDGSVSNLEAMRYARDNYGGSKSGSMTSLNSNCQCRCDQDTTTGLISLVPDVVTFIHQYGSSPCPQTVGTVQVLNEGGGSFQWSLTSLLPPWLSANVTSGSAGDSIQFNFTCNGWAPTMASTLSISANDPSTGLPLPNSPVTLPVSGSVQQ
jgi:hypothetical protein